MRFEIDKEAAEALYPALRSAYKNPLQAGYDGAGEPEWVGLIDLYHVTADALSLDPAPETEPKPDALRAAIEAKIEQALANEDLSPGYQAGYVSALQWAARQCNTR